MAQTGFIPLDVLLERGPVSFAFNFGRYVLAAGLVALVVWLMARSRLAGRRIQSRVPTWPDRRREVLLSMQAVAVYAVVGAFVFWGVKAGVLQRLDTEYGWPAYLGLTAAMIVGHDAYFYWVHRAMHHPKLFKTFHRAHHRSVTPTPWAAYSFAIPESLVMALFVPLWLLFVPTPGGVILAWLMFQIFRNAMGHAGFELHPRWWLSSPLTRWINTTTHHDLHHSGGFNRNYGLYFTWWDKWMGTEHPRYAETFEEVTTRTAAGGVSGQAVGPDPVPGPGRPRAGSASGLTVFAAVGSTSDLPPTTLLADIPTPKQRLSTADVRFAPKSVIQEPRSAPVTSRRSPHDR